MYSGNDLLWYRHCARVAWRRPSAHIRLLRELLDLAVLKPEYGGVEELKDAYPQIIKRIREIEFYGQFG